MGIAEFNRKTTNTKAITAAQGYARRLKGLPACYFGRRAADCTTDSKRAARQLLDELWWVVERLAPPQRSVFLHELGREMGGTRAFHVVERGDLSEEIRRRFGVNEIRIQDASTLNALFWDPEPNLVYAIEDRVNGGSYRPKPPIGPSYIPLPGREVVEEYDDVRLKAGIIVVPMTEFKVVEGESYAFVWSVFQESSHAKGQEGSVEVYVTAEVGAKLSMSFPVISFSFDVKTGIKRAEKVYSRDERRSMVRAGMQVSKNYVLEKISRSVRVYSTSGGYYEIETGYRIVRKEGGDPVGPFWPDYSVDGLTVRDRDSAYPKAEAEIRKLMEETAQEIARRVARQ
ncbi:MAG TPA: hypothetical protein VJ890_09770 [Vineibacter sp.]|nr:hypothetical protein [Vineibacter sp.]